MKTFAALVLAGIAQQATPAHRATPAAAVAPVATSALNESLQQSQMYAYVCANARGTQEWQNLQLDARYARARRA